MNTDFLGRLNHTVRQRLGREPANDTAPAEVADRMVNLVADLELIQRRAWAAELGLDPRTADLLALPPVAPQGAQRAA